MEDAQKKYFLRVNSELVLVSEQVYETYYKMQRREKYLAEVDENHGLVYYNSWDSDNLNGSDYIRDSYANTEMEAIQNLDRKKLWDYVEQVDKFHICVLISQGFTEREIAQIAGISQAAVNKNKKRIFSKLKKILE